MSYYNPVEEAKKYAKYAKLLSISQVSNLIKNSTTIRGLDRLRAIIVEFHSGALLQEWQSKYHEVTYCDKCQRPMDRDNLIALDEPVSEILTDEYWGNNKEKLNEQNMKSNENDTKNPPEEEK